MLDPAVALVSPVRLPGLVPGLGKCADLPGMAKCHPEHRNVQICLAKYHPEHRNVQICLAKCHPEHRNVQICLAKCHPEHRNVHLSSPLLASPGLSWSLLVSWPLLAALWTEPIVRNVSVGSMDRTLL